MNNCSLNRLWLFAKSEIMSTRKQMLPISIAVFMVVNYFNYISNDGAEFLSATVASWVFIAGFVVINISRAFQKYYHKGYANAALMLPISQSEKFTFALVYNMLFIPLSLIVVGYAINMIWSVGCGAENIFFDFIEEAPQKGLVAIISSLSQISLFFFGAVFFRRNQFAMTLLVLTCIGAVIVYSVYVMVTIFGFHDVNYWMLSLKLDEIQWEYIQIGWSTLLLIAMSLLAWFRFRKLQITK